MKWDEEDIWIIPSEMGYKDRGMMKWRGLILSEMTEAHIKASKFDPIGELKEEMDKRSISQILEDSFMYQRRIEVQLNEQHEFDDHFKNQVYRVMEGFIVGFENSYVYLQTDKGIKGFKGEYIRHVQYVDFAKWYDE